MKLCACVCVCVSVVCLDGSGFKTRNVLSDKNCVWGCVFVCKCVLAVECWGLLGFVAMLPQCPFHPKNHLIVCVRARACVHVWGSDFCRPLFCVTQSLYLSRTIKDGSLKAQTLIEKGKTHTHSRRRGRQTEAWLRYTEVCNSGHWHGLNTHNFNCNMSIHNFNYVF